MTTRIRRSSGNKVKSSLSCYFRVYYHTTIESLVFGGAVFIDEGVYRVELNLQPAPRDTNRRTHISR